MPVKVVVLFSSGVGYFEHFGTVKGNGSTELRFKTQQINDILKSLVLQDMDGGKVAAVTYPSQDPVAKTLRSFQVDITANPSLADLLDQLRGAKVSVTAGAREASPARSSASRRSSGRSARTRGKPVEVWCSTCSPAAASARSSWTRCGRSSWRTRSSSDELQQAPRGAGASAATRTRSRSRSTSAGRANAACASATSSRRRSGRRATG